MHRVQVRERVADGVGDRRQDRIGELPQAIVNPQSLAARLDQPGSPQIGQMAGRLRLRDLQALVDVADADLAGQEQPQDAEPRRIGECLEQGFHLDQFLVHISALTNISCGPGVCIFVYTDTGGADGPVRERAGPPGGRRRSAAAIRVLEPARRKRRTGFRSRRLSPAHRGRKAEALRYRRYAALGARAAET